MSLHLTVRRVLRSIPSHGPYASLKPYIQQRTVWWWGKKSPEKTAAIPKTLTEDYLRKKPTQGELVRGDLASSSIFEDEKLAGPKPQGPVGPADPRKDFSRGPRSMAIALNPLHKTRKRWERKMVVREVMSRGRITRSQHLKRQERELLSRSHYFKTSVKKLNPLARQITGKTIEEAIVQMRFSKKKAAKEVLRHLEHTKNAAIVKRGMGLGGDEEKLEVPLKIQTKDGKRIQVQEPTKIYVDEAWVGRGEYGSTPDHRARGVIYMMRNPSTSLSVVLKEEVTRIRLHREREEKIKNRKVWVQLPNRPVTAQRQHYSW